ncbi:MAG: PQQ-binding-like beta-propeller repeat protein [Vicinamibacterales bacterium]
MPVPIRRLIALLLLAWCWRDLPTEAQVIPDDAPMSVWGTNGEIRALARAGQTLFVGGTFDIVGPASGGLAIVSAADASHVTPSAGVGTANRIAPDGAGGWYAAQWYTAPLGVTVQHVRADGTPDPAWVPPTFGPGASIYHLARAGGRVYAAGSFGTVNGVPRPGAVAFDATTGALLPWTLTTRAGGPVYDVPYMAAAGDRLYFAIRSPATDLLAIDATSGTLLPFQPASVPYVVAFRQLAASPDRVYAVGDGCGAGGTGMGLCAFDAATGARAWTWSPTGSQTWLGSVWAGAGRVYVSDATAGILRALDATTGADLAWSTPVGAVFDLAELGDRVYVVTTRTYSQTQALAVDRLTGADLDWTPVVGGPVWSVGVQDTQVAIGGGFRTAGGVRRRNLVGLDLATGRPIAGPAIPEPIGNIHSLAAYGDIVFVGLESTSSEVFAFSASTGQRFPWGLPHNGRVLSMLVARQTLYVGGYFSRLGGEDRGFLGAVDLTTGALLPWNPALDFEVSELTASGTTVYAAGRVQGPFGGTRGAAFELGARQRLPFEPQLSTGAANRYLAASGGRLLTTGRYWGPGRAFGVGWLALDSGRLIADQPMAFPTTYAASSGDTVILGGYDDTTGEPRVAALHAPSSRFLGWEPSITRLGGAPFIGSITHVLAEPDIVAIAGALETVAGRQVAGLAVFRTRPPLAPWAMTASVQGQAVSLGWLPNDMPVPESFIVEVGTSAGAADIGVFPVGNTTAVSGALGSGRYYVRVKGIGGGGLGPASSEVILDVPEPQTPPSRPGTLLGSVAQGAVHLRWDAATGNPATYIVEAGTASGLANLAVFPTGYLDTWLNAAPPPGTYYVRVRATNAFGVSPPTNEVTLVVP